MSCRGKCHDSGVVERLFDLRKRKNVRRRSCCSRDEARQNASDYIEMFRSPIRKYQKTGMLSAMHQRQEPGKKPTFELRSGRLLMRPS